MAVPYVELKDKYGNDFCLGHCGDIFLPPFPFVKDFRQHVQAIKDMDVKPNDVIITGYPKTGTHWHHEIINMLIRGSSEYSKESGMQEFLDMKTPEKGSNPPGSDPRVFFTHLKFHHLPKQVFEKKVKVVYLLRNPKDAWVSLYNHVHSHTGIMEYPGTWNQFFSLLTTFGFCYGDWFDYVLDWEKALATQTDIPVFVSHFEDLKQDPVGQIEKLDQFLGYNRGRQLCEAIAEACKFTNLKDFTEK
ncbi:hypothetical protein BaRGS_00018064, partial [Batillaria attramentaria]